MKGFVFWVVLWKKSKDKDKTSWLFAYAYFLSILYTLLKGLPGLIPEIHETKHIENYPKIILKVFNACFLHVLIWCSI